MNKRYFSRQEATEALKLVSPIMGDILQIVKEVSLLKQVPFENEKELNDLKSIIQSKQHMLIHHINELHNLGVRIRDIFYGIIDFPTLDNGKEMYYCWQYDEPEICFYHGKNCNFSKRKYLYNITNKNNYGTQD
jgi:hypothetical protein